MAGQITQHDSNQTAGAPGDARRDDARWREAPLFAGLDADATAAVAGRLRRRSFAAGEVLIREGQWCGELFVLRSGVVQVSTTPDADDAHPEVRDVLLRRLVAGECVGEMSLITGAPPSATVRALTDGEAWALGAGDFAALASAYPSLTRTINVILSERLLYTNRQQSGSPPQQVVVAIAEPSPFVGDLARALSGYSSNEVLHVDFGSAPAEFRTAHTLHDLRSGCIHFSEAAPGAFNRTVIRVRGTDAAEDVAAADITELLVGLKQVEKSCRRALITLPPHRANLTAAVLPFAQHVLVVGSIHAPGAARDLVASLPMDPTLGVRPALGVVLTDAAPAVIPTDATLEGLTGLIGAPVRGVIPASGARQHAAIDALARWVTGQRVGLALGGGGAKGWAHLGVLRVLARANVPLDCIAGASIGAMVAASVACGTPPDAIERQMARGSANAFRPLPSRAGLLSSRGIARFLRSPEAFGDRTIEDLPTPLAIVATDLNMGREIVIRRGPIWQAVLASAALPAFFPPVRIGGNTLVDGGVVNPVPVSAVQLLGADKVIAVDISASLNPPQELEDRRHTRQRVPGMLTNVLRSLDIMAAQIRAHAADEPGIRIKPELAAMSLRQFRNGAPLIAAGEAAAEAALPELVRELPWLRRP